MRFKICRHYNNIHRCNGSLTCSNYQVAVGRSNRVFVRTLRDKKSTTNDSWHLLCWKCLSPCSVPFFLRTEFCRCLFNSFFFCLFWRNKVVENSIVVYMIDLNVWAADGNSGKKVRISDVLSRSRIPIVKVY